MPVNSKFPLLLQAEAGKRGSLRMIKICPVCEHELIGSFCPVCRAVVKNPWFLSDGVYLNRSHYATEVNCEFHDGDRKTTFLNRRHPSGEKECSYHFPFDGAGFENPLFRKKAERKNTAGTVPAGKRRRKWL